ncbi:MAG: nitroreductase family protein, partial [Candidatus Thalassarchaeaceae archaeon]
MGGGANDTGFIDLIFEELTPGEMISRAKSFYQEMNKRRTTRHFSTREVSRSLIEAAIKTAGTAPSGAHLQPWTFVAISNQELKQKIREAA